MTSASLAIAEADETTKLTKGLTTSILERIGMTPTSSVSQRSRIGALVIQPVRQRQLWLMM